MPYLLYDKHRDVQEFAKEAVRQLLKAPHPPPPPTRQRNQLLQGIFLYRFNRGFVLSDDSTLKILI